MNWLARLWHKAQYNIGKFLVSSVRVYRSRDGEPQPFAYSAAMQRLQGWVYTACMLNANAAASIPLRMYARPQEGRRFLGLTRSVPRARKAYLLGDATERPSARSLRKAVEASSDFVEVVEHPVLELLSKVNPYLNGFGFASLRFQFKQLTGNAYMHPILHTITGVPVQLWPLPAHHVTIVPGKVEDGEFIQGYVYGAPAARKPLEFEPDEVIHFKSPNPRSLYYGLGKVEAGWTVIQQDAATHEYDVALYRNFARPDYAVIVKGATGDQLDRLDEKLHEQFRGSRDAGKFASFGGDVTITPLAWPPKDLGGRENIVEEIAGVFGVPVTKLKANDPNRANAETGDASWMKDTVHPMLVDDEEELNASLLPLFGAEAADNAFLAYDNPVPQNREFEHRVRIESVNAGLVTIDEARGEEGLGPIEGGDVPRVNGVPLGTLAQSIDPLGGLFSVGGPPRTAVAPLLATPTEREAMLTVRHVYQSEHRHCTKHLKAAAEDDVRDDEPESVVGRLMAAIRRIFRDQVAAVVAELPASKGRKADFPIDTILGAAGGDYESDLEVVIREELLKAMGYGGEAGLETIGYDGRFDVTSQEVLDFIDGYAPRLAGTIQDETMRGLRRVHAEWARSGGSIADLTTAIRGLDETVFSPARAEAIARTESARAYVEGQVQGWEQSEQVAGKRWLLAPGACEFCRQAAKIYNGSKLYGLRDIPSQLRRGAVLTGATGGRMKLDYESIQGPPLHPNDRCDLVPVLKGEQ